MRITILIFLLCGFFAISVKAQNCKYDANGYKNVPCANELVSYIGISIKEIKGTLRDPRGDIVVGGIVSLHRVTKKGLEFVGSLEIGEDGKYCFKNMPHGKYVVKAGFNGFKCTQIEFNLNSRNRRAKKQLDITLELGT